MNASEYIQSNEEIIENIKFIRNCLGLTQQEVANKLNVDRSTYSYYELGRIEMRLSTFVKLCRIFNVNAWNLTTKDGIMKARMNMNKQSIK